MQRPGYSSRSVGIEPIREWIAFMTNHSIRRGCAGFERIGVNTNERVEQPGGDLPTARRWSAGGAACILRSVRLGGDTQIVGEP